MNKDRSNYQYNEDLSGKNDDDTLKQEQLVPTSEAVGMIYNHPNLDNNTTEMTPTQRRERILTLSVIAFIAFLTGVDYAIILPTAWGYINTFMHAHYAGFAMGVLLSVFALSGAISGVILGYLNDVGVSLKRLILFACIFKIVGNLLYFIGINIYVVIVSRLIAGIGMGIVPPLLAEISRRSTPEKRTQLLAKILGCRQVGLFLGPCLTILLRQCHFTLFGVPVTMHNAPGLIMAILWIILAILAFFFFYELPAIANNHKSLSNILHDYSFREACKRAYVICKKPVIVVLLITSFIAYFNQTVLETTLTPFTNYQFGWRELEVSILFAVAGIEIALVYVLLHFISKKFPDQTILLTGYAILSIACLIGVIILPLSPVGSKENLPLFLLFVTLDIFALPLIVVTSTSLFTQQTDDNQQGVGQGIQRFVINIATVVGPLYAGSLLQSTWIMLCTMLVIVLFATFLITIVYRSFSSKSNDELTALIPPVNTTNSDNS